MGYFTKQTAEDNAAAEILPLTRDLIAAGLTARDWNFGTDDDGDIGGVWGGHVFFFLRYGRNEEILQIRGRWNREIGPEQLDEVLALVNAWNTDKIWPKVYVRQEDDLLGVYAECATDLEHGVTRSQLDQLLLCAISSGVSFFDHLDEAFPAAAEAARAVEAAREAEAAGSGTDSSEIG